MDWQMDCISLYIKFWGCSTKEEGSLQLCYIRNHLWKLIPYNFRETNSGLRFTTFPILVETDQQQLCSGQIIDPKIAFMAEEGRHENKLPRTCTLLHKWAICILYCICTVSVIRCNRFICLPFSFCNSTTVWFRLGWFVWKCHIFLWKLHTTYCHNF